MKARILASLLAALLLLQTVSCGDNSTETTAETAPVETEAETDSLEARKLVDDGLGSHDFGGEEFRMLYQERYSEFQYVEEMTGDTLDDAIYNRNMNVEDRFNAKIGHNVGAEEQLAMDIKNAVLAGNDEYDLYMGHTMYTGKHSLQGIFRNMYDLGIDFSKPFCTAYSGLEDDNLKVFLEESRDMLCNTEAPIATVGCVIGAHVGPGAVAIAYFQN